MNEHDERTGPFWDAVDGRAPMPPVAGLLGWELQEVDPEAGTIVVRFEGRPEFTNPLGNIQGGMLAAMLDDTGLRHGQPCSLRWIFMHMIEEYARHNGHADLIRELVDGSVGD